MKLMRELVEAASGRRCLHCNRELSIYLGECYGHPVYDDAMRALRGIDNLLMEFTSDNGSREQARMRRQICGFVHKEVVMPTLFKTLKQG